MCSSRLKIASGEDVCRKLEAVKMLASPVYSAREQCSSSKLD